MANPDFPGYLPTMLGADKSNRLEPVSVQMAWTSIFLPQPLGPVIKHDLTRGAVSCTICEP